jgi:hypothetical protein
MNTDAERLAKNLNIKAGMIIMGEVIAWGSDAGIMDEAAALIRKLAAENEALRVDAERYRWLRRNLVGLSFSDSLIASLCKDQSELDAAMKGEPHAD